MRSSQKTAKTTGDYRAAFTRHVKFHRLAAVFGSVALLQQAEAGNFGTDPNALSKIREFIDKPPPEDLILKPKKKKKQAESAEH